MRTTHDTARATSRTRTAGRPAGTPAYYLGRSASMWASALRHTR